MRKRRGRGEGSVSQRSDGLWVADLSTGMGPNGRRVRFRRYARTKREAELALLELKNKSVGGTLRRSSRVTLKELFERWLRDEVMHRVEPRTMELYQGVYTRHILRHMGGMVIEKITPVTVQNWQATLVDEGIGPVTRRKALGLLKQVFTFAKRLELLSTNPAENIRPPKIRSKARTPLTFEQVERYLEAVKGDRLAPLVLLAVTTTMREGELLGLQWSDVQGSAIHARHALKRIKSGTYRLGEISKSASSRRRIDLPKITQEALAEHRKAMIREGHGSTFVFCTTRGTPINPSNLRERFHYPMLEKSGNPKVTFHDLRHTAATMLLALGVHPKIAQERLGHSTIAMTMDLYSHSIPAMGEAAAELLDQRLRKR